MDAPTSDQKIFRVERRAQYPTMTPEMPKSADYREVVQVVSDKPLYHNAKVSIDGADVLIIGSVYEDAAVYKTKFRELDTCCRVFAVREYDGGLVQAQEVYGARALARWGEITPLGQDADGNIFLKTLYLEGMEELAVYKTHLTWQDAQAQTMVPGPDQTIGFPIVGLTISGTVQQGSFGSIIYVEDTPPCRDLPPEVWRVSPFCWDAQAYGLVLVNGKVSIDLQRLTALGDPATLVILQESADGLRWDNIGGEVVDGALVSTVSTTTMGLVAIGVLQGPMPVQIASIKATGAGGSDVRIDWATVSEIDNYGFDVQAAKDMAGPYQTVANSFCPGHGTTVQPHTYSLTVQLVASAAPWLRLRQTDLNGAVHFSEAVLLGSSSDATGRLQPLQFQLDQNYPNPFNPTTTIRYGVPHGAHVVLTVYNVLGQRVQELVNDDVEAGYHEVRFDAHGLASGVYLYRIAAGDFNQLKRLLLVR